MGWGCARRRSVSDDFGGRFRNAARIAACSRVGTHRPTNTRGEDENVDTKRRALLTEPGEPLIVALSPIESAIRHAQFTEATGVPAAALTVSDLCSIPLPVYPADFGAPRRWPSVRPEAMWHPLLWMPPRVANRYFVDATKSELESDDLWSVRVALSMTMSGLYDDSSGTWVDILSLVDIDIDTSAGVGRVRRWLDGGPDVELDGLSDQVAGLLELSDPDDDLAATVAMESLGALRISAWAFTADNLFETCLDLRAGRQADRPNSDLRLALEMISNFALVSFARMDCEDGTREIDYWLCITGELSKAATSEVGSGEQMMFALDGIQHRLGALRDTYWPQMLAQAGVAD